MLASCSPFVKGLLESGNRNCECESLTVHLPDFSPAAVKNLLGILYTGKKDGFMAELTPLQLPPLQLYF